MTVTENTGDLLLARLEDTLEKSRKGRVGCLSFLTPREVRVAQRYLRETGSAECAFFWGGYPEAERKTLFLLPDYLTACLSAPPSESPVGEIAGLLDDILTEAVCAVRVQGSGYRALSHRDYLGSVLGLGIARDAMGDIAVQSAHSAVIFCPAKLSAFLIQNLTKVASDTVRCSTYIPDDSFTDGRKYAPVSNTVASPRLDCVVASLTNLSREAAQNAIRSGLVEVEFEPVQRTDLSLIPPATISVRGHGRYILRGFDGETRKGRLRMRADKLI